jgi:hypothetical protein
MCAGAGKFRPTAASGSELVAGVAPVQVAKSSAFPRAPGLWLSPRYVEHLSTVGLDVCGVPLMTPFVPFAYFPPCRGAMAASQRYASPQRLLQPELLSLLGPRVREEHPGGVLG